MLWRNAATNKIQNEHMCNYYICNRFVEVPYLKTVEKEYTSIEPRCNTRWVQRMIPAKYTNRWVARTMMEEYW